MLVSALTLGSCSRSGLNPGDLDGVESFGGTASEGGFTASGGTMTSGGVTTSGGTLTSGGTMTSGGAITSGGAHTTTPNCVPSTEVCNGRDDDCNGQADELPGVPCPGGGASYCVGGRMSACPMRCEVCVPGSERICFVNFCTFWGTQTCTADGRSFGSCREERVPDVCKGIASSPSGIAALEQCCIDRGFCCVDEEDLDHDGNRHEMLGQCEEVTCG